MFEFDDKNIFAGYIKQLLHTFNLPLFKVYKQGDYVVSKNQVYLKNDYLVKLTGWTDNDWTKPIFNKIPIKNSEGKTTATEISYSFGMELFNLTKTLEIKNNYYDYYTHEFLGNYLRFLRDYKNFNLMSLYNCFSNRVVKDLNIKNDSINFVSADNQYKIYMLPVKFFKTYTIAIESESPIEIVCGFYGKNQDPRDTRIQDSGFYTKTYFKRAGCAFNQPFVYSKLEGANLKSLSSTEIFQDEVDLKMFIKVPFNNTSSVVVLEGFYPNVNDRAIRLDQSLLYIKKNHSITNYGLYSPVNEGEVPTKEGWVSRTDYNNDNIISSNQLLTFNAHKSYPFADRLIEYLVGNPISKEDQLELSDNIKRLQTVLKARHDITTVNELSTHQHFLNLKSANFNYYKASNPLVIDSTGEEAYKNLKPEAGLSIGYVDGQWDQKYPFVVYDILKQEYLHDLSHMNRNINSLGFVDKDAESLVKAEYLKNSDEQITITLDVDIYEEN